MAAAEQYPGTYWSAFVVAGLFICFVVCLFFPLFRRGPVRLAEAACPVLLSGLRVANC